MGQWHLPKALRSLANPRSAAHPDRCCPCRGGKDLPWHLTSSSPLLDLRAAEGGVDALVHEIPIDLVKHLVDVGGLGAEERALAKGCRLEELDRQAAGAHLSSNPDPALAIIHDLLGLIDTVADAALGHEHGVLHLCLQAFHAHLDVPLADGAGRRALPEARVTLEALRREVAIEELDNELCYDGALGRVTAAARDRLGIKGLNVRVGDLILAAPRAKSHSGPLLAKLGGHW